MSGTADFPQERKLKRRKEDTECLVHEERLDHVDRTVSKQSGWLKTAAVVLAFSGTVLGSVCNLILSKLSSIESLLSKTDITLARHEERICGVEADVKEIKERHKYLDQNGVIFKKP
jgi:hypothetical protein